MEVLNLEDDGDYANSPPGPNFFLPLPQKKLREHTVDILDDFTRQRYQDHVNETYPGPNSRATDRAIFFSYRLDDEFTGFPRKGIELGSLRGGSMWIARYVGPSFNGEMLTPNCPNLPVMGLIF
jgi:hypothetical protein